MKVKIINSGSDGNSSFVTDSKGNVILLDCGLPYMKIVSYFDFSRLDCVLISHIHQDHIYSKNYFEKYFVPIYSPQNVKDGQRIELINWVILPMTLIHNVECYGFLVYSKIDKKVVAYITDTTYIPKLHKVDALIIDCNYSRQFVEERIKNNVTIHPGYKNHLSVEQVGEYLEELGNDKPNLVCAFHLSNSGLTNIERILEVLRPIVKKVVISKPNTEFEI